MEADLEPFAWLGICGVSLLFMIPTLYIIRNELSKRRSGLAQFATPGLRRWSFLPMILGFVFQALIVLHFLDGLCHVLWYVATVTAQTQLFSRSFYQISRLHACFASRQSLGYPKWVFRAMYAIGYFVLLNIWLRTLLGRSLAKHCGIDAQWHFYSDHTDYQHNSQFAAWGALLTLLFWAWDLTILALYSLKIRGITRSLTQTGAGHDEVNAHGESNEVIDRVLRELRRIRTLTISYQIVTVILVITMITLTVGYEPCASNDECVEISYNAVILVSTVLYSYAPYLMLQHNTAAYDRFAGVLRWTRLECLCCATSHVGSDVKQMTSQIQNGTITKKGIDDSTTRTSDLEKQDAKNVKYLEDMQSGGGADLEEESGAKEVTVATGAVPVEENEPESERTTTSALDRQETADQGFITAHFK